MKRFESQKVQFGLYSADNWEQRVIHSNILFSTSSIHFAWHNESAKVNTTCSRLGLLIFTSNGFEKCFTKIILAAISRMNLEKGD